VADDGTVWCGTGGIDFWPAAAVLRVFVAECSDGDWSQGSLFSAVSAGSSLRDTYSFP
jgi:hypothetical protein